MRHHCGSGTHPVRLSFGRGTVRTAQSLRVFGRLPYLLQEPTSPSRLSPLPPLPQIYASRLCEKHNSPETSWYCWATRSVCPVWHGAKAKACLVECCTLHASLTDQH